MRRLALILIAALGAVPARALAAPPSDEEAMISAAMVFNIARFSSWPEEPAPGRGFEVCYDEDSGMADAFATIAGKEVGGRLVRPVAVDPRTASARRCHVYYTSGAGDERVLAVAMAQGSLTIGRGERFLRRGGAVRLRIDGKPRFSVNVRNAHAAGVRPSSKLLRLAEEVVE